VRLAWALQCVWRERPCIPRGASRRCVWRVGFDGVRSPRSSVRVCGGEGVLGEWAGGCTGVWRVCGWWASGIHLGLSRAPGLTRHYSIMRVCVRVCKNGV
jgi:hypothetical protein